MHIWWGRDPQEIYWLEITDRPDLGADLNAPQLDDSGNAHWGYSLIREIRNRDVVFHYHKDEGAIVAWSIATGSAWEDEVIWAARGTVARTHGVEPYARPGWRLALRDHTRLAEPVIIEELRAQEEAIRTIRDELASMHSDPLYFPIALSSKRPLRTAQSYLTKFPRALAGLFPALGAAVQEAHTLRETIPTSGIGQVRGGVVSSPQLGTSYRDANEEARTSTRDPFEVDPAEVERSLRGHARTQNLLAEYLQRRGIEPRSARGNPHYDLAWEKDGTIYVAEVKSMSNSNQEKQLRLGLGQVLRYRQLLTARGNEVVAVLAAENEPRDSSWMTLCEELGVMLVWPEQFSRQFGDLS